MFPGCDVAMAAPSETSKNRADVTGIYHRRARKRGIISAARAEGRGTMSATVTEAEAESRI